MINDIILFVHIVQQRGLAAAAKQLNIPAATVTRRLQRLEARLDCQLIHRSARQFSLTTEGEVHYQAYAPIVQQFEKVSRQLDADMHEMSGSLKVLAPTNVSIGLLQPMWSQFIQQYPDIQLQLVLNNQNEDLLTAQADMALRIGPQQDSQLYQKRLGFIATVLAASNDYLSAQGVPTHINELHKHQLIGINAIPTWQLKNIETDQKIKIHPLVKTQVNDVQLASQFAMDGIGIGLLPMSEIADALEGGKLQQVLTCWQGSQRDIFVVWPSGRLLSAKAKCLLNFMDAHIKSTRVLQGYHRHSNTANMQQRS